ncbi:hypothetical protein C9374_013072 [Naegleria lovaniensis]|uniref:Uncharacterized protein n=1 Tax=Naegleria lovaniensis TaxID=51637 RepID=A0AA88GC91_NAELO|nr:uncharacterized protein C9374_013072 [Naegleria lovaniensis]KAG2372865.1 hypothetical protein C9374_013072 [Naegleria lovaniensis]
MSATSSILKAILKYIPKLDGNWHITILILNIIFPGIGTLVAACVSKKKKKYSIIFGLLQFFTSFLLVGWIWSVVWGIFMFKRNTGAAKLTPDI